MVEDAREQVAALAGAKPGDVIFTSGGTEANALALRGAVAGALEAEERITRLFVSAIAHDSVLRRCARSLAETHARPACSTIIPVDRDGLIDPQAFRSLLMKARAARWCR